MKKAILFLTCLLLVFASNAQIANFIFNSKVYTYDIIRADNKSGYIISISGDSSGVKTTLYAPDTLLADFCQEIFTIEFKILLSHFDSSISNINKENELGFDLTMEKLYAKSEAVIDADAEKDNKEEQLESLKEILNSMDPPNQDTIIKIELDTIINLYYHEMTSTRWRWKRIHMSYNSSSDGKPQPAKVHSVQFNLNDGTMSAFTVEVVPLKLDSFKRASESITIYRIVDAVVAKKERAIQYPRDTTFTSWKIVKKDSVQPFKMLVKKDQFVIWKDTIINHPYVKFYTELPLVTLKRKGDLEIRHFYGENKGVHKTWVTADTKRGVGKEKSYYYTFLTEVLVLHPFDTSKTRIFLKPRDNEAVSYFLDSNLLTKVEPIYVRERDVNSYFNIDLGTDLLGVFGNNNSNGKLKTQVSADFNIFRSNSRVNCFQTIHPFIGFTNFSKEEENIIPINTAFINDTSSFVHGIKMMQVNVLNGGIGFDLVTARFSGNNCFRMRFTTRYWEIPFLYTDAVNSTSKNFNASARSYELGFNFCSEVSSKRIKWTYGINFMDFRITNDTIRQFEYRPVTWRMLSYPKDVLPGIFFSSTFDFYYSPVKNSYSQVFLKWNYSFQISMLNRGENSMQVQIGYTMSLTEFLKALNAKSSASPNDKNHSAVKNKEKK
jgi:hypothetical protein